MIAVIKLFLLKNKRWMLTGFIIISLMFANWIILQRYERQKDIAVRWEQNYKGEIKRFKDKTGQDAIKIQETQLTLRELKRTNDSTIFDLFSKVQELSTRNRQLEQLLSVKTVVRVDSTFIQIRDTLIIRDSVNRITRVASYKSKWLDAFIAVHPDSLEVINYESRDEIIISLGWFKNRKFFISRWFEPKKWGADIKSMNPNSNISGAANIRITDKRGRE